MPTRRCRTRTTTASAITESTSPWTMVEPVRSGGQPRTNGWGSSTSRACASKLSMADSPGNRSTTTAVSTSSWPVGKRSAWPSRQRQGDIPAHWRTTARRRLTLGSVVAMSRVLVTGISGTGKSSALAELGRRGYRVVDTGDPGWREYREYVESSDELHRGEWLWIEDRITGLLDSDDGRSLFVEGCVRNQSKFYDRFNAVVLLSAPVEVILDRVARRTTNNYGKTPLERAMILDDLANVEPLLRASCTHELDASRPLADIVADLTAIASRPITTS